MHILFYGRSIDKSFIKELENKKNNWTSLPFMLIFLKTKYIEYFTLLRVKQNVYKVFRIS